MERITPLFSSQSEMSSHPWQICSWSMACKLNLCKLYFCLRLCLRYCFYIILTPIVVRIPSLLLSKLDLSVLFLVLFWPFLSSLSLTKFLPLSKFLETSVTASKDHPEGQVFLLSFTSIRHGNFQMKQWGLKPEAQFRRMKLMGTKMPARLWQ